MKIIFCLSYLNISYTLSLKEASEEVNIVVTSNPNISLFLKLLYPNDQVILLPPIPQVIERSPVKMFKIIYNKYFFGKVFKTFRNCDVYFFSIAFCSFESWLVKKLSKRNTIFYKPDVNIDHLKLRNTPLSIFYVIVLKAIYGITLEPLWDGKRYMMSVGKKYLEMINAKNPDHVIATSTADSLIKMRFNLKISKVLLLTGGIIESDEVEREEYISKMDVLLEFLFKRYEKDALMLKVHPRYVERYSREKEVNELPSFLPGNMILRYFPLVIGYSTAALFEAANQGCVAIALSKYMKPRNEVTRDRYITYLKSNTKKELFFPETLTDIEHLLNNKNV